MSSYTIGEPPPPELPPHPGLIDLNAQIVDLSGCEAGDEVGCHLGQALGENRSITALDLSKNGLGEATATELGLALSNNKTLRFLNLSGNKFDDNSMKALSQCLRTNRTLEVLSLSANPLGDAGLGEFASKLGRSRSQLSEIVLLDTAITHVSVGPLTEAALKNGNLMTIGLPYTVGHRVIEEVDKALAVNWERKYLTERQRRQKRLEALEVMPSLARSECTASQQEELLETEKRAEEQRLQAEKQARLSRWKRPQKPIPEALATLPGGGSARQAMEEPRDLGDFGVDEWTDPQIRDTMLLLNVLERKRTFKPPTSQGQTHSRSARSSSPKSELFTDEERALLGLPPRICTSKGAFPSPRRGRKGEDRPLPEPKVLKPRPPPMAPPEAAYPSQRAFTVRGFNSTSTHTNSTTLPPPIRSQRPLRSFTGRYKTN